MTVQSGELSAKRSCQTFVLGGGQVERMFVGDGPRDVVFRYPGVRESLLHIVEGNPLHCGLLRRFQAVPNGR